VTFTTAEILASVFGCAALAFCARGRATGFFGGLEESLAAGEIGTAGLLATTLRLHTLGAAASVHGSFDEAFATLKLLTIGLWSAALAFRTFRIPASVR
jgi:hypothetical protein